MDLKHDVYTIPILCILRIVIILFLKLKDIKKNGFSLEIIADMCIFAPSDNRG